MATFIQEEARIVIHFSLSKCLFNFCADGEYRSLFETNSSGGKLSRENRVVWESYLFGELYEKAEDGERVKYGSLNLSNDRMGNRLCEGYGSSYMVLRDSVRSRCTVAHDRKYARGEVVSSLRYCYAVLSRFHNK